MQVDPIKPTLKAPGTKRLKVNCVVPLSNFAFNFNLRRYNQGERHWAKQQAKQQAPPRGAPDGAPAGGIVARWTRSLARLAPAPAAPRRAPMPSAAGPARYVCPPHHRHAF